MTDYSQWSMNVQNESILMSWRFHAASVNLRQFVSFMRMMHTKRPVNIERIESMGLLAVKLAQAYALRSDFLPSAKTKKLQTLYQKAAEIPTEDSQRWLHEKAPEQFFDRIDQIDPEPLASASVGQVHHAILDGERKVVVKIIKGEFERTFRRDLKRLRRYFRMMLLMYPRLGRVANPMGVLRHVEQYTLAELDLRNEIEGAKVLEKIRDEMATKFPMPRLNVPTFHEELSNRWILVSDLIEGPTMEERLSTGQASWDDLLDLFRIQGAFMFGIGTFHGDLHPGNVILQDDGSFFFLDNAAVSTAPERVRKSLYGFFDHLSRGHLEASYESLLGMSVVEIQGKRLERYRSGMATLYDGFVGTTVAETSLTRQMMETVKMAVRAGCKFDEQTFPVIKSLMFMDGMVLRASPEIDLITQMGPALDEFKKVTT